MSTLTLDQVRDLDCVARFSPLTLDLSANEVSGAAAVLRRVLYRWCTPRGALRHAPSVGLNTPILDLDASTWSSDEIEGYAVALEREAKDEDYVLDCTVALALSESGTLKIRARVTLVDGRTYPLEVAASAAGAALTAIGGN